jgi:hypothetical protein
MILPSVLLPVLVSLSALADAPDVAQPDGDSPAEAPAEPAPIPARPQPPPAPATLGPAQDLPVGLEQRPEAGRSSHRFVARVAAAGAHCRIHDIPAFGAEGVLGLGGMGEHVGWSLEGGLFEGSTEWPNSSTIDLSATGFVLGASYDVVRWGERHALFAGARGFRSVLGPADMSTSNTDVALLLGYQFRS